MFSSPFDDSSYSSCQFCYCNHKASSKQLPYPLIPSRVLSSGGHLRLSGLHRARRLSAAISMTSLSISRRQSSEKLTSSRRSPCWQTVFPEILSSLEKREKLSQWSDSHLPIPDLAGQSGMELSNVMGTSGGNLLSSHTDKNRYKDEQKEHG